MSREKNKYTVIIMTMLSLIALSACMNMNTNIKENVSGIANIVKEIRNNISAIGLIWLILGIALFLFYKKTTLMTAYRRNIFVNLLSLIFSVFILLGLSFKKSQSFNYINSNLYQIIQSIIIIIGYFMLFKETILYLVSFIINREANSNYFNNSKLYSFVFMKNKIIPFLLLIISWLPYLLVYFPGSLPHDGAYQINMYYGSDKLSNHHPVFSTFLMGIFMDLGRLLGNDGIGVLLYVVFQTIIFAVIIVYLIEYMKKLELSSIVIVSTFLFFSIVPMWGAYLQAEIKDILFFEIMLWWFILIVKLTIEENGFFNKRNFIALLISSILMYLMNNKGLYIILGTLFMALFIKLSKYRRLGLIFIILFIICFNTGYHKVVFPLIGVSEGSSGEMLSIPFQQTARYIATYPDEVTESEAAAINKVLKYKQIADKYDPNVSNPIKNLYRGNRNVSKDDKFEYLKAWFSMLLKHPGAYLQATIHNSYGYFYPDEKLTIRVFYPLYIKQTLNKSWNYDYTLKSDSIRKVMEQYIYLWTDIPVLSLLFNTAIYTWITLFAALMFLIRKKYKFLIIIIPSMLNILICIASPVNGVLRYVLPTIVITPLMLGIMLKYTNKENENSIDILK